MINQKDTELIQNILKGDSKAQEILYEKYRKAVRDFLKNKYSTYHDLDDDVSEIIIKVFLKLDTFDETKSKFRSWVFNIAKNHVIDKWRCCSTITVSSSDNITLTSNCTSFDSSFITANNAGSSHTTTGTYTVDFDNCSSISYITTQLSPTDYTFLDMKYVLGYDYNEIGAEFNLTSSTVSNRVNYIKTKLKKNNPEIIYD